jgi:hypothetical protein
MAVVGFLVPVTGAVSSIIAAAGRAALLTFILPAMINGRAVDIPPRLLGWGVACAVAIPAARPTRHTSAQFSSKICISMADRRRDATRNRTATRPDTSHGRALLLQDRQSTLVDLASRHRGGTVVVVGHAETVAASFAGLGLLGHYYPFELANVRNAAVTEWVTEDDPARFPPARWTLVRFNDAG